MPQEYGTQFCCFSQESNNVFIHLITKKCSCVKHEQNFCPTTANNDDKEKKTREKVLKNINLEADKCKLGSNNQKYCMGNNLSCTEDAGVREFSCDNWEDRLNYNSINESHCNPDDTRFCCTYCKEIYFERRNSELRKKQNTKETQTNNEHTSENEILQRTLDESQDKSKTSNENKQAKNKKGCKCKSKRKKGNEKIQPKKETVQISKSETSVNQEQSNIHPCVYKKGISNSTSCEVLSVCSILSEEQSNDCNKNYKIDSEFIPSNYSKKTYVLRNECKEPYRKCIHCKKSIPSKKNYKSRKEDKSCYDRRNHQMSSKPITAPIYEMVPIVIQYDCSAKYKTEQK